MAPYFDDIATDATDPDRPLQFPPRPFATYRPPMVGAPEYGPGQAPVFGGVTALPSSPAAQGAAPAVAGPVSPAAPAQPSAPESAPSSSVPPSQPSFFDQVMASAPSHPRPLSKAEIIAATILAGTTGWATGNAGRGAEAARGITGRPEHERELGDRERDRALNIAIHRDSQIAAAQDRAEREKDRQTAQKERDREFNEREKDRQTAAQDKKAELDRRDQERQESARNPKNETELEMAAVRGDKDAVAALKAHHANEIDKIHAARDPQEKINLMHNYMQSDIEIRGQLAKELEAIRQNPRAALDPELKKQADGLASRIKVLDSNIEFANGEISKHLGVNRSAGPLKPGTDMGAAPPDRKEGSRGTDANGNKVVIKGGRIIVE